MVWKPSVESALRIQNHMKWVIKLLHYLYYGQLEEEKKTFRLTFYNEKAHNHRRQQ